MASGAAARRFPVGAERTAQDVSFRIWAPDRERVAIVLADGAEHSLEPEAGGYFSASLPVETGALYRIRLDAGSTLYPDPASRRQPEGPHGPSEIVDPAGYAWKDDGWRGVTLPGQIIYEMHVGTFTPEGTFAAAAARLQHLKDVGVTLIEMMPVNEFPGRFGWGYDGVNLFAPTRLYGSPDDLRAFVDAAHALGLGVILDVVYNHFGPDGNYLHAFAKDYHTDRHANDWGASINFDDSNSAGVRDFFVANAAYWIEEFHFDGLRLDATQAIPDSSPVHVITELGNAARRAAGERSIVIIAENEPQHAILIRSQDEGGSGLDALWNDDLHHSAMVALTGRNEAYYQDHLGSPQEFISAAKYGSLFQGQAYAFYGKGRGMLALDVPPAAFVTFIQNHDQISNSAHGSRFHCLTSPGRARAMTALMLLLPGTPMLFQGQEFWSSAPFTYFADHNPDLAKLVREGRAKMLTQFPSIAGRKAQQQLPDPESRATFESCRLDWSEVETNHATVALHRDLLKLRRDDATFAAQAAGMLDGAVLAEEAFVLRFFGEGDDDRLLFVNLGRDLTRKSFAEPLVAPPTGRHWVVKWSSEDPAYDGGGTPKIQAAEGWRIPGNSAVVLAPG